MEPPRNAFFDLGLRPELAAAAADLGFREPTAIQRRVVPEILAGRDVIGIARTGSGKTLSFGLPLIHRLVEGAEPAGALILAPTRDLAEQIQRHLDPFARAVGIETVRIVGGAGRTPQRQRIERGARLLVGTPGRVLDLFGDGSLDPHSIGVLVLDECDRLLDLGFEEQVLEIVSRLPADRQSLLFSATFPDAIRRVAKRVLREPRTVEADRPGTVPEGVRQRACLVEPGDKLAVLLWLLSGARGRTLVFARTRRRAAEVRTYLRRARHRAECLHGDLTAAQRRAAIERLEGGRIAVLVATDLGARGLDFSAVEHVVHLDVPDLPEDHVHRTGRTARRDREGLATTLVYPDERVRLQRIEAFVGASFDRVEPPQDIASWRQRARSVTLRRPSRARDGGGGMGRAGSGIRGKRKRRMKTKLKARRKRRRG